MQKNYQPSLEMILHHEGGYVNHPRDPGGETNLGVTKRVYEEFGGEKDMKDLTVEDVAPIYKKGYWDKCKCDQLPSGLDLVVFDFAVNAGPGRAAQFLQRIIREEVDEKAIYIQPASLTDTERMLLGNENCTSLKAKLYLTYTKN